MLVRENFPFANSMHHQYTCPDWAKALVCQKYQLKKDSVYKVLPEMALHGVHFKDYKYYQPV